MPLTASPNFAFLAHHDPRLVVLGTHAERYFADDPNACLVKLRQFGEILAQHAAARLGLLASPVRIVTALAQQGIHWDKGEHVQAFNPKTQTLDLVHLADEVNIDIDGFNRLVVTESYNRVVCAELAHHLDPLGAAKTLVFAANDAHADLVVRLLKEAFEARYGTLDDDAVLKITGAADQPLKLLRRFKNERLPSVAVTVDLLTTGVDIPKITSLVFLRRVKSRILYEQMLGRATRLCPSIDKTVFRIFDAVDLYDALAPFTEMQPVAPAPSISFFQLVRELGTAPDPEARQTVLDQLIAKLQRRRASLKGTELTRFEAIAAMSPKDLAQLLKQGSPEQAAAWFQQHQYVIPVLDGGVLRHGDVVFNPIRFSIGSIARYYGSEPVIVSPEYQILRCGPSLSSEVLVRYLRTSRGRSLLDTQTQGSVRYRVYFRTLERLRVSLAPPEMQQRAERLFFALRRVWSSVDAAADRLKDLERSILAKAFRGELVPQDPNDEPASVLLDRLRAEREQEGKTAAAGARARGKRADKAPRGAI